MWRKTRTRKSLIPSIVEEARFCRTGAIFQRFSVKRRQARSASHAQEECRKKTKTQKHLYPHQLFRLFFPQTPFQSPTNHNTQKESAVKCSVHRPHVWPILERLSVNIVPRFSCIDMNENGKFDFALGAYSRRSLPKFKIYAAIDQWRHWWTKAKTVTNMVICRGVT